MSIGGFHGLWFHFTCYNTNMHATLYTFRYGELALKRKQRSFWEFILKNNIEYALNIRGVNTDLVSITFSQKRGFIIVAPGFKKEKRKVIEDVLAKTPGIVWWGPVITIDKYSLDTQDLKKLYNAIYDALEKLILKKEVLPTLSGILVKKYLGKITISSLELKSFLYKRLIKKYQKKYPVDKSFKVLIAIDKPVHITYYNNGLGGLPISSTGKGLVLFSGGIDSPVAAFMAFKRGIRADLLHFAPPNSDIKTSKVYALFKQLREYNPYLRLYATTVPSLAKMLHKGQVYNSVVLFKRLLIRVGATLVRKLFKIGFLITGDSVGQVASQTLSNLLAQESVLCEREFSRYVFMLRPLSGFDKREIVGLARQLGTYELSIQESPDCCELVSRAAKTSTDLERMRKQEFEVEVDSFVEEALNNIKVIKG